MADTAFDRARFEARLATRHLGRPLIHREVVESTNDVAWEALAAGAPPGTCVIADVQTRGRGRAGRAWHTTPGSGLALSVLVAPGCDLRDAGLLPLLAGLALARGLESLGARAELKWPNDLQAGGRKLAGILCESRGGTAPGVMVVGVGVNVGQRHEDLPAGLEATATSLALEGCACDRVDVAVAFLHALELVLDALEREGVAPQLDDWRRRAALDGRPVRVRTASGVIAGTARGVDDRGALLVEREGTVTAVLSGDVEGGTDLAGTPA